MHHNLINAHAATKTQQSQKSSHKVAAMQARREVPGGRDVDEELGMIAPSTRVQGLLAETSWGAEPQADLSTPHNPHVLWTQSLNPVGP